MYIYPSLYNPYHAMMHIVFLLYYTRLTIMIKLPPWSPNSHCLTLLSEACRVSKWRPLRTECPAARGRPPAASRRPWPRKASHWASSSSSRASWCRPTPAFSSSSPLPLPCRWKVSLAAFLHFHAMGHKAFSCNGEQSFFTQWGAKLFWLLLCTVISKKGHCLAVKETQN